MIIMKKYIPNTALRGNQTMRQSGFTLIEMAVVLVIVGIVVSILATILPSLVKSAKIKKAVAILEKTDSALQGLLVTSQKLPYADSDKDGTADNGVYFGWLPYKDFGLSSGDDTWGNRLKYGVYEDVVTTDLCSITFPSPVDTTKLYTVNNTDGSQTQQLYVIISGGDPTGQFEDRNANDDAEYDEPRRMVEYNNGTVVYNDLLLAGEINTVKGAVCSGGGGGGGGSGCDGTESVYCGNCDDGEDNDNDGSPDCADTDCSTHPECANPTCDIATSSPLSSGTVNSDYSVTFSASAGCVGNLEWQLINNGGFSGFYLHPYTGHLSGTLSQCPGIYTDAIEVKLTDSDDPANTATKQFTTEVTDDLSVACTSGCGQGTCSAGTDICWDSPVKIVTFKVNGGHIGDIDWTLDTGGATGFSYASTGEDTCVIKKDGATTGGAYSFKLTATDHDCSGSNTANIVLSVEVSADGTGTPHHPAMEAEWRFDECTTWDGTSLDVVDTLGESMHYGKAINGTVGVHAGKNCRAASFDGVDDMMVSDVLAGSDIMVFNDQVTLACWFKSPGGGKGSPRLIEFSNNTGQYNYSTALVYDTDGSLRAWVTAQGTTTRGGQIDFSQQYNDNKWHHAVYTYSQSNGGKLYVDGGLKQTATDNPTGDIWDAETFAIGGVYNDTDHVYKGLIDEVMVLHDELTPEEVAELYETTRATCSGVCYADSVIGQWNMDESLWDGTSGEVTDSSGNNLDGYAQNGATTTSAGKVCRAGNITGTTQGVIIPDNNLLDFDGNPFTIAFWYWLNQGSTGAWDQIFVKGNGSSRNYAMWMRNSSSNLVLMSVDPSNQNFYSVSQLTTGKWYFINAVHENGSLDLYITEAGNPLNRDNYRTVNMNGSGDNSESLYIGRSPNYTTIQAKVDQFVLYNRALAENELTALMNAGDECPPEIVSISTTSLPDGTINSTYSATVSATGGTTPYAWEIVSISPSISGLSIVTNVDYTGTLQGTTNVCDGTYNVTLKVTDAGASFDQKDFILTVATGTLSISPSAPQSFNCTSSTFYRDFSVSAPSLGSVSWNLEWLVNPGGFELIETGANTLRFRKLDTSSSGTYSFKITGVDGSCPSNTFDSGYYAINISGDGVDVPYYNGLVAEWRMDDCAWVSAGDVTDSSGNSLDGSPNGSADTTSFGKTCRAGVFNGTDAYVTIPAGADELDITGDISISLWFYPNNLDSNLLTNRFNFAGNEHGYHLQTKADGTVLWASHDASINANDNCIALSTGTITQSQWNHIVVTKADGSTTVNFYINGSSAGTDTISRGTISYTGADTRRWIGAGYDSYTNGQDNWLFGEAQYTDGKIDEVMVFSRVLSPSDIQDIYALRPACPTTGCYTQPMVKYLMEEGSWSDGSPDVIDSMGSYHGTGSNGANTVLDGACRAGSLDSTQSQDINCGNIPMSGDTTLSCWLNASAQQEVPFHKDGCFTFIISPSGQISYADSSLWSYAAFGYHDIGFTFGTWNHIVISKTGSTVRIYENGDLKLTTTFGSAITSNNNNAFIGSYNGGSNYYNGLIDEVIMWNRGLSESTIKNMYEAGRCAE